MDKVHFIVSRVPLFLVSVGQTNPGYNFHHISYFNEYLTLLMVSTIGYQQPLTDRNPFVIHVCCHTLLYTLIRAGLSVTDVLLTRFFVRGAGRAGG